MDTLRQRWAADALETRLRSVVPGLRVVIAPSVGSTNSVLLSSARGQVGDAPDQDASLADTAPPCLLVAQTQTQGRGRLGRAWVSAGDDRPGSSLTFSLSMGLAPAQGSGLSLAVGVALAEALEQGPTPSRGRVRLKWPNDLWLADAQAAFGGRKLGGVLIETVAAPAGRIAVVGVGLNVRTVAVEGAATGVASWAEIEPEATPPTVLNRIAPALVAALVRFEGQGLAPFLAGFDARDALRGRAVTTTQADARDGWAEGIDAQGALRLRLARGRIVAITSGEVSVRPADEGPGPARSDPECGFS